MGTYSYNIRRRGQGCVFSEIVKLPNKITSANALVSLLDIRDLEKVAELSNGNVHLTFGSALDIFGGKGVKLDELIEWNKVHES